jgi:hypothetical protein
MAKDMPEVAHGGMNPRAKKVLAQIQVSEAENGGHVAEHHFESYEHKPEMHVFAKGEKHPVMEGHIFHHLAKHLGIPHEVVGKEGDGEMEEEEMENEA